MINTVLLPCKHLVAKIQKGIAKVLRIHQRKEGIVSNKTRLNYGIIKIQTKEEQLKLQQLKIKNMKYFNDIDDFNQDNEQNENIYGTQSYCSYDENQNEPDHNQFKNSVKDNRQLKIEDDNNLRISNQFDEDKQKSTANQRSPCDRDFLSSYKQQQEMKDSRQNPTFNQSISDDNEQNLNLSSQQQLTQQMCLNYKQFKKYQKGVKTSLQNFVNIKRINNNELIFN